jgi:hypothetical protein
LAPGILLHAEWLVNPVLGGVSTALIYIAARGLYGPKTGLVAAFLWATSAWVLFMSATYMNHVGAVTCALGAWALVWGPKRVNRWHAFGAGLLLALVAMTRPLDAVAATLPVAVWVVAGRRATIVGWMALGVVPVALLWGGLNWSLFGSPITLGYTVLQGEGLGLGFHTDPWGREYTPLVGLSNMVVAIRRLHIHLYEWPVLALLPFAGWALFGRQRGWRDVVVAVGFLSAPLLYFFYWHSGYYPGPRFYYIAAPFIVIGTARAWRWAWGLARRARCSVIRIDAALVVAVGVVLVWGWSGVLPRRWEMYRAQLATMKLHPEKELVQQGVGRALVIIPESWSSRIVTNLWGLEARPELVERALRQVDACDLHRLVLLARNTRLPGSEVSGNLAGMLEMAGSAQPVANWPDPSLRLQPRRNLPSECRVEMQRDLEGFTTFGNLAWRNAVGLDEGIVFARDLYERNDVLFARYPGWQVWRFAPARGDPDGLPVMEPLGTTDSLRSLPGVRP